jgi:predicted Zn-dependent peptidase
MVEVSTLANGFRIITDEVESVQTVTIAIGANVGSRNETEKQNGISHFLEHMAF